MENVYGNRMMDFLHSIEIASEELEETIALSKQIQKRYVANEDLLEFFSIEDNCYIFRNQKVETHFNLDNIAQNELISLINNSSKYSYEIEPNELTKREILENYFVGYLSLKDQEKEKIFDNIINKLKASSITSNNQKKLKNTISS